MSLMALSSLDGRYASAIEPLTPFFSEYALIRYRVMVEVRWLQHLSQELPAVRSFTKDEHVFLEGLIDNFALADGEAIKQIEKPTNHDVKAVEYWIKRQLENTSLADISEWVHFACTSEDINNLSHALMLKEGIIGVILPRATQFVDAVATLATALLETPMLARTHGQTASPTTVGKELAVFVHRWRRQLKQVSHQEYLGKINGAVGNFNAHVSAFPEVNWPKIAEGFVVVRLGLTYNPLTTQIESHDYMAETFHSLMRFNTILLDFDRDIWSYISVGYFKQRVIAGEVGSSTMPHKVNPIDFENSEANVGLANSLFDHLSGKLAVSRLQRDLSDSSAIRSIGTAMGYTLLAINSAMRGLTKLEVNHARLAEDLDNAWEVLAEPIQTVMRTAGLPNPYEQLKALTRGAAMSEASIRAFVTQLDLPDAEKRRLLALTPATYVGLATQIADDVLKG
jgi:adenylosuccinate lyase